jgi:hypothetical protein
MRARTVGFVLLRTFAPVGIVGSNSEVAVPVSLSAP